MIADTSIEPPQSKGTSGYAARRPESRPLLATSYMRRFVLGWKTLGYERGSARIVSYAGDYVICCRARPPGRAAMRSIMDQLRLTINEAKTRVCKLRTRPSTS